MGKVICPYCNTKQTIKQMGKVCISDSCSSMNKEIFTKEDKCPTCKSILRYVCVNCKKPLEFEELKCKPLPIAIIGAKNSGKSNFIAVAINEFMKRGNYFGICVRPTRETIPRYNADYYNPIYKQQSPVTTTTAATGNSTKQPLIFMFTTGINKAKRKRTLFSMTFYDTAGENLQKSQSDTESHVKYMAYSKGIILLLDPWQIPYVKDKLSGKIPKDAEGDAPYDILTKVIGTIRTILKLDGNSIINIPIAISFSKIDSLETAGLLQEESCLKHDSAHQLEGKYLMVEHEDTNSEIDSLLKEWSEEDADSLINLVKTNFVKYSFFGISSFGCGVNVGNKLEQKVKPRRVLDPFLWLLSLNKRIDTKK